MFITNEPLIKEFKSTSLRKRESDPKVTSKKQQGILRNKTTKHIGKAKKKCNMKITFTLVVKKKRGRMKLEYHGKS